MSPNATALLACGLATLPVLVGLFHVYMKNGINAAAFSAVCEKLLLAGETGRFEKLLVAAGHAPLIQLVQWIWERRHPPALPMPDFDGYRQAGPPPSYVERLKPVIAPEVHALKTRLGRTAWWTLPGLVPFPIVAVLLKRPRLEAPWIIATVLALLCAGTFVSVQKQRNQVTQTLERLVPLFEPHAEANR